MFCSGPSRVSWRRGPLTSSLGRQDNHLAKRSCLGQLWTQRWGMTYIRTHTHLIGCHLTVPHRTTPHLTASHSCFILYTECVLCSQCMFACNTWNVALHMIHLPFEPMKMFSCPSTHKNHPHLIGPDDHHMNCLFPKYVRTYIRTYSMNQLC